MSQPPPLPKRKTISGRRERILAFVVGVPVLVLLLLPLAWRWHLEHTVNRQIEALRAARLPTSGTELNAWYAQVPEAENAASILAEAFQLWRTFPDARSNRVTSLKLPPRGELLSAEDRALLAEYVQMNAAALTKAQAGAQLAKCRYPVDYTPGFDTSLPHLAGIKRLGLLAQFEAVLTSESGRAADTARAIETILGLARSLESEPDLIGQLLRFNVLAVGMETLEHALQTGSFNGDELARLSIAFAAAGKTNCLARALVGERATAVPLFRRFAEGQGAKPQAGQAGGDEDESTLLHRASRSQVLLGVFDRDLDYFLTAMQTNISLASESPPRSLAAVAVIEQQGDLASKRFHILSGLLLPSFAQTPIKEAGALARVRLAQSALAVERFRLAEGRLPKDLGELVPNFLPSVPADPFDGAPLRYRQLPKGYQLYSVDRDGQDNGGREKPRAAKSTDKTAYDLVFQVER